MIVYIIVFITIFIIDILTKYWALGACNQEVVITPFLSCELIINRGFSWSLFHSSSTLVFFIVSAVILCAIGALGVHTLYQWRAGKNILGEVMVLSGALANMLDRVMYGGVIDFIVVHYQAYTWPVFNVADMAVVVGVACMFFINWHEHETAR